MSKEDPVAVFGEQPNPLDGDLVGLQKEPLQVWDVQPRQFVQVSVYESHSLIVKSLPVRLSVTTIRVFSPWRYLPRESPPNSL